MAIVAVAGCGRLAFDPLGGDGGGPGSGSDARGIDDVGAQSGGPVGDTCSNARLVTIDTVPMTIPLTGQSMAGLNDDYPAFTFPVIGTCSTGIDAVYRLNVSVTANLTVSASTDFAGSFALGLGCPLANITQCGSIGSGSQTTGVSPATYSLIIERTSGGTTFDLTLTVQ